MSIKHNCDFCGTATLEHVYTPINSARGMLVFVCHRCGLMQSFSTIPYKSRPPGSMSADADRSSYRYTKDVISDRYEECFTQFVDFPHIQSVLDVGSNRGAFIAYLEKHHPGKKVVGVEPAPSITEGYALLPNVSVQACRFESAQLPENHFDFAYCAHTLEHADSARGMLLGIRRTLKPSGQLFIAVPSLIFYRDIIEEIFIDPHTYHFNFDLLMDFVSQIGFKVEYAGKPQEPELMLLLKKSDGDVADIAFTPSRPAHAAIAKVDIARYAVEIQQNRASLKDSARQLNEVKGHFKVVIWGGGRILDALVRFGGLELANVHLVVDKYLHRYVDNLHGCKLVSPDVLRQEQPDSLLVYIASRDYADEICAEAGAMGIKNIIKFGK